MPKPTKGPRLGGSAAHQRHILSNLATALFEHGRITTTEAKARTLRPYAEKLITKAKRGDLHNRREVLKTIHDKSVVHALFTEIGPSFSERPGGYTRITKIGPRKGDNAPMAVIELVTEDYKPSAPSTTRRAEETAASPAKVSTEKAAAPVAAETAQVEAAEEPSEDVESPEPAVDPEPEVEAAPGSDDPATEAAEEDAAPVEEADPVAEEPADASEESPEKS